MHLFLSVLVQSSGWAVRPTGSQVHSAKQYDSQFDHLAPQSDVAPGYPNRSLRGTVRPSDGGTITSSAKCGSFSTVCARSAPKDGGQTVKKLCSDPGPRPTASGEDDARDQLYPTLRIGAPSNLLDRARLQDGDEGIPEAAGGLPFRVLKRRSTGVQEPIGG
jgi:hypothetical protein